MDNHSRLAAVLLLLDSSVNFIKNKQLSGIIPVPCQHRHPGGQSSDPPVVVWNQVSRHLLVSDSASLKPIASLGY
jgi:hypothetical protein